ERWVELPTLFRQVVRALRHPAEERPVVRPGSRGRRLLRGPHTAFVGPARTVAGSAEHPQRQHGQDHNPREQPNLSPHHRSDRPGGYSPKRDRKRRTRIELASTAWKAVALPLSYRRAPRGA